MRRSGRLIYALWSIQKERNMRTFTGSRIMHYEVAMLAFDDIKQRESAFGVDVPTVGVG